MQMMPRRHCKQKTQELTDEQVDGFCSGSPDNFRDNALKLGHALLKKHGGPRQYLQASLPTKEDVTKVYEDVAAHFPCRSDIEYATWDTLPGDTESTLHIRLSDLRLSNEACAILFCVLGPAG